ncbi:MAG TPA: PIG-L family deacetylase, partial [Flavitalea sp.]|nr:PIG-L family deacetylase [Flavitalea sp.]
MNRKGFIFIIVSLLSFIGQGQSPVSVTSAEIYLQIKKLNVLGSVLYIAAHPDDENSRLLAYLSNEKLFRTGYLSITRGDGGQNLIGDEQGIDLGLIRTQELLSARRIDGAEQYFTRGYDFGFSKSTDEAFAIWDKEKVLSDVVWVIRKFQPDVIITRFPEDSRAGHGHHSGSAVLAREAFFAAADPSKFTSQFNFGVKPWKAKRIFWNTFNFGNTNTTSESQLKIDVGGFNAILGKGYGEIAALSRSQHKSQGFGVPANRGEQWEYFKLIAGDTATADLTEGIDMTWSRIPGGDKISSRINDLLKEFSLSNPELSVPALMQLYSAMNGLNASPWKEKKLNDLLTLIESCSGLWMEAYSGNPFAVHGDSIRLNISVNSRLGGGVQLEEVTFPGFDTVMHQQLAKNKNTNFSKTILVPANLPITQPYWLEQKMNEGSFNISDQLMIGMAEGKPAFSVTFRINLNGVPLSFQKPVRYKYTDPVKGELYEPLSVIPAVTLNTDPGIIIFRKGEKQQKNVSVRLMANRNFNESIVTVSRRLAATNETLKLPFNQARNTPMTSQFTIDNSMLHSKTEELLQVFAQVKKDTVEIPAYLALNSINYDHIPDINYFYQDVVKVLNIDLKTEGKRVGYIEGAGDKVLPALEQMGYDVVILKEKDLATAVLSQFDAVITGVRAYNVHAFLTAKYDVLMEYVRNGGNLIVQYNTNSQVGPNRAKIGPYPFNISRGRVTDEKAVVNFLLPEHPVLNYPNKIT